MGRREGAAGINVITQGLLKQDEERRAFRQRVELAVAEGMIKKHFTQPKKVYNVKDNQLVQLGEVPEGSEIIRGQQQNQITPEEAIRMRMGLGFGDLPIQTQQLINDLLPGSSQKAKDLTQIPQDSPKSQVPPASQGFGFGPAMENAARGVQSLFQGKQYKVGDIIRKGNKVGKVVGLDPTTGEPLVEQIQ